MKIAMRILSRQRRRSALLILVVALAAGASGALYAVVEAWLYASEPVRDPATLTVVYGRERGSGTYEMLSYPLVRFVAESAPELKIAAYSRTIVPVREGRSNHAVAAALVSSSYFRTLGVALTGRDFGPGPCLPTPETVVSEADVYLRGQSRVVIAGRSYSIVGSVPPTFGGVSEEWGKPPQLWFPLCDQAWVLPNGESAAQMLTANIPWVLAVIRRPGDMSHAQLAAELTDISRRAAARGLLSKTSDLLSIGFPQGRLFPTLRRQVAITANLLSAGVVLLLALAFLNAAGLYAAVLRSRRTELATMQALGALAWRIAGETPLLALLIGCLAAAPSLLFAWALVNVQPLLGGFLPFPLTAPPNLSWRAVALILGADIILAVAASLLGWLAAGATQCRDLASDLMGGGGTRTAPGLNTHVVLLGAQAAPAAFILVWAGALMLIYVQRALQPPGFKTGGIETATLATLFDAKTPAETAATYRRVLDGAHARGLRVALASALPGDVTTMSAQVRRGQRHPWICVKLNFVSPEFFLRCESPYYRAGHSMRATTRPDRLSPSSVPGSRASCGRATHRRWASSFACAIGALRPASWE